MKWSKSPPELIEAFDAVLPGPPVERRPMFGYPAAFLNGNMVCGLFQDGMVLRLDETTGKKILSVKGCKPFAPMKGRTMTGFYFVPGALVSDEEAITPWLEAALAHVGKMPAKKKTKKKTKKK
jgi:TfoX/Sxy family transcriptional regulator of competence genes